MTYGSRWLIGVVFLAGALAAAPALAQSSISLPRPGQVGIALQGGYGGFLEQGNVGSVFGNGPEFTVRLRYRMRYDRALGLSFEAQKLDARVTETFDPANPIDAAPEKLSLILSGLEFYQMFGTRTPAVKMLMVGVGLAQYRTELNSG